jgi:flagellar biosynthetic protein FlhB
MAENEDGQEKTEEPSSKRLDDARRKGQVPRSRELSTVAMTLSGGVALVLMSRYLGQGLHDIMRANLAPDRQDLFDPLALIRHLAEAFGEAAQMLAPFFALMVVVAVVASVALGGFNLSTEAMLPKFSKINPLSGFKRLVSARGLVELAKALAKFVLVAVAAVYLLRAHLDSVLGLSFLELVPALGVLRDVVGWSFVLMAATLLLVAVIDVPFQLWDHKRQLKMTRQEVKDERKQTDGNPEIKGRIRSMQRELAFRRMMQEVPKADVIVTNPSHFAVALRYDQTRMRAPKVVAKGADLIAKNIRRVGTEAGVPVVEAPVLARALYHSTEIGDLIPRGLYLAVAQLLAYLFQLEAYRHEGGERPVIPDLPVPEDLHWSGG